MMSSREDPKLEHLRRDPRCLLLSFEAVRPFRGIQVRGTVLFGGLAAVLLMAVEAPSAVARARPSPWVEAPLR